MKFATNSYDITGAKILNIGEDLTKLQRV